MATRDSITPPSPQDHVAQRPDLVLSFLEVARTATDRALRQTSSAQVRRLVRHAQGDLAAAYALVRASLDDRAA